MQDTVNEVGTFAHQATFKHICKNVLCVIHKLELKKKYIIKIINYLHEWDEKGKIIHFNIIWAESPLAAVHILTCSVVVYKNIRQSDQV